MSKCRLSKIELDWVKERIDEGILTVTNTSSENYIAEKHFIDVITTEFLLEFPGREEGL